MFKTNNSLKHYIGIKSNIFFIIKNLKFKFLLFILLSYAITSIFLHTNIIKFIIWFFILLYIFLSKKYKTNQKINYKDILFTLIISLGYILFSYFLGLKLGFLKNPLSFNLGNIIIYIIPIIGIEIIRFILINNNRNKFFYILVTLLIIISEINFNYLLTIIDNNRLLIMYLCSDIIPIIWCNIILTYISLNKAYLIPIIFVLINKVIFLLPIWPNINWLTKCMLKILELFIIYVYFKNIITKEKLSDWHNKNSFVIISYALTFILATLLVCFMLGMFKYKPITILSNSMSSTLVRGDMIVYKKLDNDELNNLPLNSIIVFTSNNKDIVHRIVDKRVDNKITYYTTKGDNNNANDYKEITKDSIKGIYVFHIKYLGYPSIWLYEYFNE